MEHGRGGRREDEEKDGDGEDEARHPDREDQEGRELGEFLEEALGADRLGRLEDGERRVRRHRLDGRRPHELEVADDADRLHVREEDRDGRHPPLEVVAVLADKDHVQTHHHHHRRARARQRAHRDHHALAHDAPFLARQMRQPDRTVDDI